MTLFQIFNVFEKYSLDILFLAFVVVILTSLIKRLFFKKHKKVLTFVPFALGIILYGLYLYIYKHSTEIFKFSTIEYGFKTGGISTIFYVFYEQFIRAKKIPLAFDEREFAVSGILSAIVIKEFLADVSKAIIAATTDRLEDKNFCVGIITDNVQGKLISGTTGQDVLIYAKLIISTLTSLKK